MKSILLIACLVISSLSHAEQLPSSEALLALQSSAGISEFSAKLANAEISTLGIQATECPADGFKIINGPEKQTGGLAKANKYIGIVGALALTQAKNLATTAYCGACQQTVNVTPFVVTQPAKVKYNQTCDGRPTMTFESDLQNDSEVESYTQAILKKKNQEGQRLYAGCPDPCAFTVYAGKRALANGKIHSTLTVNCGQPRSSSILFANYNYTYGSAVQWTCSR